MEEVIWHYSSAGGTARKLSRKYDNISFHSESKSYRFDADEVREACLPSTIIRLL